MGTIEANLTSDCILPPGVHILNFLESNSANIHEDIVDLWDDVIPKLVAYIEKNTENGEDSWPQSNWEVCFFHADVIAPRACRVRPVASWWAQSPHLSLSRSLCLFAYFPF